MRKIFLLLATVLFVGMGAFAQDNQVRRLPEVRHDNTQRPVSDLDRGFWFAVEASMGYTCRTGGDNVGMPEIDLAAGYRINQYIKPGIGIGARYFINNSNIRRSSRKWDWPIYATIRGNLIDETYRDIVPYYNFDIGGAIQDGFMVRPTIGVRFGTPRSAFTLGLSYVGQSFASCKVNKDNDLVKANKFYSAVALRVGYEF